MAKRFTDSEKWSDAWFRKLTPKMKAVWFFLCDRCDCAGVWKSDFELLSYFIGQKVTKEEFEDAFKERVEFYPPDKYLITKFISFQYGDISEKSNVFKGIQKSLSQLTLAEPLTKGRPRDMDKDKDKDKDNKGSVRGEENEIVKLWNSTVTKLPKVEAITPKRKSHINARLKECDDLDAWVAAFRLLDSQSWSNGTGDRGWRASLDYFLRPEKFINLIEQSKTTQGKSKIIIKKGIDNE